MAAAGLARRWGSLPAGLRTGLALVAVAVALGLPAAARLRAEGLPMENGFMLVLPGLVLDGRLPQRDLEYFYGPASLWLPALAYAVAGTSVLVERLLGLTYEALYVTAVFRLARPWGRPVALACALLAVLFVVPVYLAGVPWFAALGLALWSVAALHTARTAPSHAGPWAVASGVLIAAAVTFRPDALLVGGLGVGVLLLRSPGALRLRFLLGAALGLVPFAVSVVLAGVPAVVDGLVVDAARIGAERRLPIPPTEPSLRWYAAAVALATVALVLRAAWVVVRRSHADRDVLSVALGAASLGLVPEILQRADATHLGYGSLALALAPVAVVAWRPRPVGVVWSWAPAAAVGLAAWALFSLHSAGAYRALALQSLGLRPLPGYEATVGDRRYRYASPEVADAVTDVGRYLQREADPGDDLFVGPADLRRTPYADTVLYHLLPELDVATRFLDVHPGVALRDGERLARDVASADYLVLSTELAGWDEPNESAELGSDAANTVVAERFEPVFEEGPLTVYAQRPEDGAGVDR